MAALKIDRRLPASGEGGARPAGGGGEAANGAAPRFDAALRTARREQLDIALGVLVERVRAAGKRFRDDPAEDNLERYKAEVRDFLARATGEAYAIAEEAGVPRDGQQKLFQTVQTVSAEVDALTRHTLEGEGRHLALLASLDDIRGLLLDLIT